MKKINTSKNKISIVDDEDYEWLSKNKWTTELKKDKNTFYLYRKPYIDGKYIYLYMHQAIWQKHNGPIPNEKVIDHKDRNGWINIKSNLRLATRQQNNWNSSSFKKSSSKFKGVSWSSLRKQWRAYIIINGKFIHLGYFAGTVYGEIEAAIAYDEAAIKYHGEFANLNFPKNEY